MVEQPTSHDGPAVDVAIPLMHSDYPNLKQTENELKARKESENDWEEGSSTFSRVNGWK